MPFGLASAVYAILLSGGSLNIYSEIGLVILVAAMLSADLSSARGQCGGTWTLRTPATSPTARYAHQMSYDSDRGVTVLFGGWAGGRKDETWEWDGAKWTLRSPADAPSARFEHAMAFDSARKVTVLFGGSAANNSSDETWEWNGTNWSQKTPDDAPSPAPTT